MSDDAPDTIDLTSDTEHPITVTPERAVKRVRSSRRLEAKDDATKKCKRVSTASSKDDDDDAKVEEEAVALKTEDDGQYFLVDEVLERRVRKYDSGGTRHLVEYRTYLHISLVQLSCFYHNPLNFDCAVVSWVIPENYTGDRDYYKPSWLPAENLDHNSLMAAFRKFPADADPVPNNDNKVQNPGDENKSAALFDEIEIDDFSDEDEEDSEEELEDITSNDLEEYDDGEKATMQDEKANDPDLNHLEESGKFVLNTQMIIMAITFYPLIIIYAPIIP
jgi:hypothetical protein